MLLNSKTIIIQDKNVDLFFINNKNKVNVIKFRFLCFNWCLLFNNFRYNGKQETGMSVIDVGLFTGYQPIEDDLKKVFQNSYSVFVLG